MAKRHSAEEHELGRQSQELTHDPVPARPGFLRAGVKPLLAGKQHDALHEHPDIGPLIGTHRAIDGEEESDGCSEELIVASVLPQAPLPLRTSDIEQGVEILAAFETTRAVRLL